MEARMPVLRRWVVLLAPLCALPPPARAATAPRVAEVVVGPATLEAAPRVAAPIAEVTVYSDRARVRRHASVTVAAGASLMRFPELPGAVFADTIRLAASGAR